MNTQGAGVHPGDGALQPQGARSYHRPLSTRRGRRGRAPGHGIHPQWRPRNNTSGYERWIQEIANPERCGNTSGERAP